MFKEKQNTKTKKKIIEINNRSLKNRKKKFAKYQKLNKHNQPHTMHFFFFYTNQKKKKLQKTTQFDKHNLCMCDRVNYSHIIPKKK